MESDSEDEVKIYKCSSYQSTFGEGLPELREKLCDAKILAGGKVFEAHKVILASFSRYFYSIFVHNFKERNSEEVNMPPEIDAVAMAVILNYFYSGELALSQANIESVFVATDYMRLDPLLEICIEFMQETLKLSNCIRRYAMTETIEYSSPGLENFNKAAFALIIRQAGKVSESEAFLTLNMKQISKILKSNNETEMAETLYMLIIKWVSHDEEARKGFLSDLLQMLPIEGISNEFFISKMSSEPLIRRDLNAFQWLFDAFVPELVNSVLASKIQTKSFFITGRLSIRKCFVVEKQNPEPLPIYNRPDFSYFSAISYKGRIYLLGGANTENSYLLHDQEGLWEDCELGLKFGRSNAGCALLGDDLFIIGGFNGKTGANLKSCMKFNFASGRKENLPAMKKAYQLPAVAVYANSIYATCSSDASTIIGRMDAREGRWFKIGEFTTEMDLCSAATVDNYLYSCDLTTGKIAQFDFRENRSHQICSLPSKPDKGSWIASVEGELFRANGGEVFKYDAANDNWTDYCSGMDLECPIVVPWV